MIFRLSIKQDELRSSLNVLTLNENEYKNLKSVPSEKLTLQQFTSVSLF